MAGSGGAAGGHRASGRPAASGSRESGLKVIGWSKTQHSARNQALYITRTRDADNPSQMLSLENENGVRLEGKEAIEAELASWNLAPAANNHSKAWRAAAPEARTAMTADQALGRRQSAHLIFSVPAGRMGDAARLQDAVRAGLASTLGAQGHRYVFAIHRDHSRRPHAHIVVKARGESYGGREKQARQLRLNPGDLDALRQILTAEAQAQGLDVVATRRVDRARTRAEITEGRAPLRENKTRGQLWQAQPRQGSIFEAKAPAWYARHGLSYKLRRLRPEQTPGEALPQARPGILSRMAKALRGERSKPAATKTPALFESQALRRLDERFSITRVDAHAARDSFAAMYREAPRLATWAMNHHPEAFGQPTGRQAPAFSGRGMKTALQAMPAPDQVPTAESGQIAGQANLLRRRRRLAQAEDTTKHDPKAARRHLEAFAKQIERADPGKKAPAEEIRTLARGGMTERTGAAHVRKAVERARNLHPWSRGRNRDPGIER